MDATEISNNEYRQFVHWVRDSIAREKLYRRSYGLDAEQYVRIPDDFWLRLGPYGKIYDAGSDIQGGNTPFELFMDSTNNSKVDQTLLIMGSPDGQNAADPKGKNIKGELLINGFKLDKKDYDWFTSYTSGKPGKPKIAMQAVQDQIFRNYSKNGKNGTRLWCQKNASIRDAYSHYQIT